MEDGIGRAGFGEGRRQSRPGGSDPSGRYVRAGNLVDQSMTADLAGEVTSAAGPVRLSDLQRILSAIQPSGISEKSCPFGYVRLLDLLLKLLPFSW